MNIRKERLEKGLYWQKAWKLVEGCTKVSAGRKLNGNTHDYLPWLEV